ncbi:MAG: AAA domain-containing protein [Acidimicrobiia bacterium]|nr:AAA domain-containing protein [Acidimicrobiia bacterium]
MDLTPGRDGMRVAALESLLAGRKITLAELFSDDEARVDAAKRCRTIHAKALENFEERGVETLFVGCGIATWDNRRNPETIPAAPVLLHSLAVTPKGAAGEEFTLELIGDWEVNPNLLHVLASDFAVEPDEQDLLVAGHLDGAGRPDLKAVFEGMTKAANDVDGFSIHEQRVVVGNFSYAKLPMVKDLETATEALAEHDLVAAIAGDEDARASVRDTRVQVDPTGPNTVPPEDEFLVLVADASQNYAINAATAGEHMIIQGPPGTGKSQTIANLIATLSARGCSVLFVAEKRAAIEAVTKRLVGVGLGDLVLDLHGGVSSRRQVAQELASSLRELGGVGEPDLAEVHRKVARRRQELVDHVEALHVPREPSRMSAYDLQGELLTLPETARSPVRITAPALERLGRVEVEELEDAIREYVELDGLVAASGESAWSGARVETSDDARAAADHAARLAGERFPHARRLLEGALDEAGLTQPVTVGGWRAALALLDAVRGLLNEMEPILFDADLETTAQALAPAQSRFKAVFAQVFSGRYRAGKRELRSHARDGVKLSGRRALEVARDAAEVRSEWARRCRRDAFPKVPEQLADADEAFAAFDEDLRALGAFIATDDVTGAAPAQAARHLAALVHETQVLYRLPRIQELSTRLVEAGFRALLDELAQRVADGAEIDSEAARQTVRHVWLASMYEVVAGSDARIGAFDGAVHARKVDEYRRYDTEHIQTTPARVKRAVATRAVAARDAHPEQNEAVLGQAHRKRGHMTLRSLFEKAPDVLTALRPCWAMSPLMVSEVLPPRPCFDVVVFDEASQVLPADAVPALLRADRAVIAGDDRQLPPTTFFATGTADEEKGFEPNDAALTFGFESVLDVLKGLGLSDRWLTTHYRSKDERLIAFSNAHLYDWALTTFPGVVGEDCLRFELVPHDPARAADTRSSAPEVDRVVELILEHAVERPHESLGVIAMGIHHANRITDALREAVPDELEGFFDEGRDERFFVKNLERVQGDEREAIIISVGYGKQADGRLLYRFGPLLQAGGERRLNVAVSRARRRVTVVGSFNHSELDESRTGAAGVHLLKAYLHYASSGGMDLGERAKETSQLNPFEIAVRDRLEAAGVPVTAQYGSSGYRIDFVAGHPERPSELVLAIECDGASYHSGYLARERDHLRQDVLEQLGWRFHRIWSTDWYRDPRGETDKVVAAWQQAVADADAGVPAPVRGGNADSASPRHAPQRWSRDGTGALSPSTSDGVLPSPTTPMTNWSRWPAGWSRTRWRAPKTKCSKRSSRGSATADAAPGSSTPSPPPSGRAVSDGRKERAFLSVRPPRRLTPIVIGPSSTSAPARRSRSSSTATSSPRPSRSRPASRATRSRSSTTSPWPSPTRRRSVSCGSG